MKAIVYTKYGTPDVLHLKDVKKPVLDEEKVLVKVHTESINAGNILKPGEMSATKFYSRPYAFVGRANNESRGGFND